MPSKIASFVLGVFVCRHGIHDPAFQLLCPKSTRWLCVVVSCVAASDCLERVVWTDFTFLVPAVRTDLFTFLVPAVWTDLFTFLVPAVRADSALQTQHTLPSFPPLVFETQLSPISFILLHQIYYFFLIYGKIFLSLHLSLQVMFAFHAFCVCFIN